MLKLIRFVIIPLFIGILFAQVAAQDYASRAIENIRALHSGTLWVVLPSHHSKIAALRGQMRSNPADSRVQRLLDQTIADRDSTDQALRSAVQVVYQFSAYRFVYDSALVQVLDSLRSNGDKQHFFLDYGHTENGAGALIISDLRRQTLTKPFPYFVRTVKISALLDTIFGAKDETWRYFKESMSKLNGRLHRFYARHR